MSFPLRERHRNAVVAPNNPFTLTSQNWMKTTGWVESPGEVFLSHQIECMTISVLDARNQLFCQNNDICTTVGPDDGRRSFIVSLHRTDRINLLHGSRMAVVAKPVARAEDQQSLA